MRQRTAYAECQALFARYPRAAQAVDDTDRMIVLSTARGPHDLVRHVFGPWWRRRVFFRFYPSDQNRGIEIDRDRRTPPGVAELLAAARPQERQE